MNQVTTWPFIDSRWLRDHPLPDADPGDDKEGRGHVLVVGGSDETPGAAVLAAAAALRAGAGKLTILTTAAVASSLGVALPEAKVVAAPSGDTASFRKALGGLCSGPSCPTVILVGPGMTESDGQAAADEALRRFPAVPVILDASAMQTALTRPEPLGERSAPVLMTPHAGELAGLCEWNKERVTAEPIAAAQELARRSRFAVLLKGATTLLVRAETVLWEHGSEQPGLATSGSGDVLAGVIAGLIARGADLPTAAAWGVAIHSRCAVLLTDRYDRIGFLASDMLKTIPKASRQLTRQ